MYLNTIFEVRMSGSIENPYENFIALSRYARWIESERRRETWEETVSRYFNYITEHLSETHGYKPEDALVQEIKQAVLDLSLIHI